MREITYTEALSEALREEMARDEAVFTIGEDIGPVRQPEHLWDQFRERRIWQTPISESGFTGVPYSPPLEDACLPQAEDIVRTVRAFVRASEVQKT